jgi:putative transposase
MTTSPYTLTGTEIPPRPRTLPCFPIARMARVLGVSKAGHHAWVKRLPSAHAEADATLLQRIRTVHASSRQTYGAPRVHAALQATGDTSGLNW